MAARVTKTNAFYRDHYHHFIYLLMVLLFLLGIAIFVVYKQLIDRPLPQFNAMQKNGSKMNLTPATLPNLTPDTIIKWASKGAVLAYTFNFVNYNQQLNIVRGYFTENGWKDYLASVNPLLATIRRNQLFVNSVVAGAPIISNQGALAGYSNAWRVQIPFLVVYNTANGPSQRNFLVTLTIVEIPTYLNPHGIGIDQFVMSGATI